MQFAAQGPLPVDAHLMVERPEAQVENFAKAGAKIITIHAEAGGHLHPHARLIREHGCLAGIALNPATSPDCLRYLLPSLDLVLVMTVNPGYGGQKMIPECLDKIAEIRAMLDRAGSKAMLEVDGGAKHRHRRRDDAPRRGRHRRRQRPLWRGRRQGVHKPACAPPGGRFTPRKTPDAPLPPARILYRGGDGMNRACKDRRGGQRSGVFQVVWSGG